MKPIVLILLFVIAAAASYLAYSEYQRRSAAADFVERMSDPDRWLAKKWIERAEMTCDLVMDVVTVKTNSGSEQPERFTCYSGKTGFWTVRTRLCEEAPAKVATGYPREDGQVFMPLSVVCLDVEKLQERQK